MIAISDTGPLRYLIATGDDFILPVLYREVLIPAAVRDELSHPNTPEKVRERIASAPAWLSIRTAPAAADSRVSDDGVERVLRSHRTGLRRA